MSEKKTWLGKFLVELIGLFKANWINFAIRTADKVPNEIKEKLNIVIRIVEAFKKFVDSPTADLITALIPGDIDDKVKEWLRERLKDYKLEEYKLEDAHLHLLAAQLTKDITDLSFGQSAFTIEAAYQKYKSEQTV